MRTHNSNPSAKGAPHQPELHSIELFAGAGGLGIGFSSQGVSHEAVIEWDKNACETIKVNKLAGIQPLSDWPNVTECDVRTFSYESFQGIDLVTGGPPCQPFSMGGKHRGFLDERDMFPEAIRAVREASPRAFVFENVRGLMRSSFFNYFNYIKLQLEFPSIKARANEEWSLHLARLEKYKTSGALSEYKVIARLANACNFGVPQKRERVFFVGFRADVHRSWTFPTESHSEDALLYSKWITGEYWDRHELSGRKRPTMPDSIKSRVLKLSDANPLLLSEPWLTVRDALCDLPVGGLRRLARWLLHERVGGQRKEWLAYWARLERCACPRFFETWFLANQPDCSFENYLRGCEIEARLWPIRYK